MSFILNALRKSELERLSNHEETLEDKILLKQGAVQKDKPGWIVLLIIINSLLLAFFFWNFNQQEKKGIAEKSGTVSVQPKAPIQIKKEKPLTAVEQAKAPNQIIEEKTIQVQNSKLISIAQQIENHRQKKEEYRKQQVSLRTEQIIKPAKVNLPAQKVVKKSIAEHEVKTQKPDLLVSNIENDPPYLSDLSYDFRLSVPNININVFVYSENPADRFIMINMRKYLVGEIIDKEMELQEIRPDSIVVEFQDKVFQIKR